MALWAPTKPKPAADRWQAALAGLAFSRCRDRWRLAWVGRRRPLPGLIASQGWRPQPRQRRLLHAPALGHGLQLVLADRAAVEVSAVGVGPVEAADARCGSNAQANP